MRHRVKHKIIGGIFKLIAFVLLWNWLIPDLFNGPHIGFLQGFGLLMLAHLIFGHKKGCGCRGPRERKWRARMKQMMKKEWDSMSDEEREQFKRDFGHGHWDVNVIEVEEEVEEEEGDEGKEDEGNDGGKDAKS